MGAATAKQQEPSMEEILASIRRIIADDQDDEKPSFQPSEPVRFPSPQAAAAPPAPPRPDLPFTLPPARPRPVPEARMTDRPSLEIEVPEISFGDTTPGPAMAVTPPEVPEPAVASVAAPEIKAPQANTLISSGATESVNRAFNMLSQTVLTENARTLEDLVQEMLKPMLKMWLDDNLPPLVERLVRNEIERVARGRA